MVRRVMTARTFHFDAEKRGTEDDAFRRHRRIVLRGDPETGRTAKALTPFHPDQLGHEKIQRLVIEQRLINPPTKRPGVIQRRIDQVRILREHIQPVTRTVVGPTRIGEQAVDRVLASFGGGHVPERRDLRFARNYADSVERDPP